MKPRVSAVLPWLLWTAFVVVGALGIFVSTLTSAFDADSLLVSVALFGFPTVGALIASRQPKNAIGWIFITFGLGPAIYGFSRNYATYALVTSPGSLPGARWFAWLQSWVTLPTFLLGMTFLLLLYPNGRLLTRRWRWVAWSAGLLIGVITTLAALQPGANDIFPGVNNPVGVPGLGLSEQIWFALMTFPLLALVSVTSLVLRFRRSRGDERLQMKWFTYIVVVMVLSVPVGLIGAARYSVFPMLLMLLLFLIPVSVGVAILKHRLFDIDVVINKTILYGLMALVITLVYAGIVVGVVAAAGDQGPTGQVVASAGVAFAFQPAKHRLQRFANRLVYGRRATPYEVMSELSHKMAATISADDLLPQMAEAVANGIRAAETRVKVVLPGGGERQASHPSDASGDELDHAIPVMHLDETVGEIAVTKSAGDPLSSAETKLLGDFASQAGLAFHNVRLAAELEARVRDVTAQAQELSRSSERIIAAQNEERRRLEREIHQGPQELLTAMRDKVASVQLLLGEDLDSAIEGLDDLALDSKNTVEKLRDITRGLFPQLLADRGLVVALEAQAMKSSRPVDVRASSDVKAARFDPKIEAAVYFCCVEATSQASGNSMIDIRFADDHLLFEVRADIDVSTVIQNMSDRIEALGGTLKMGRGLTGRVPAVILTGA